jgi:DNA-binding beta-propeller fold protein YncE
MHRAAVLLAGLAAALGLFFYAGSLSSQAPPPPGDFVNFESGHVHPVALSPDGTHLFVVNTPDMRLSVFSLVSGSPVLEKEIPVGIEPVAVAARNDNEVWVVNNVSDDVSIVDVSRGVVVRTLRVGDEPTDVVFAGTTSGVRAFVCVSQEDAVKTYDPANLAAAPQVLAMPGRHPRALAKNGAGTQVYVTIQEAGNRSTVVSQEAVSFAGGPPPAVPAPSPAIADSAPGVGLIVKKTGANWLDETGQNWNFFIQYDVTDYGLVILDANARAITGQSPGVGTVNFNAAWNPANHKVYVTNEDALNLTRFEPNLKGRFYRNRVSIVDPATPSVVDTVHLNKHINYAVVPGPASERDLSLALPLDLAWNAAGTRGYLAAFGSSLIGVIDAAGNVLNRIAVGGGPSGVAVDGGRNLLYVVNRFDNTLSVVSLGPEIQTAVVPIGKNGFDPTPDDIKQGRAFQYDARLTSGHGDLACGSCHVFTNMDNIPWDLGNPLGTIVHVNDPDFPSGQIDPFLKGFHPMKGPMMTQTLRGIGGTEPFHWRGDRLGLDKFNPAFQSLLGNDRQLTGSEFASYDAFVKSVHFPPNPRQNLDRTFATAPIGQASPARGFTSFQNDSHDGLLKCVSCHALPNGTNGQLVDGNALQETQDIKVPELRNLYEKTGFRDSLNAVNKRGSGFIHDGTVDNLFDFLKLPVFTFSGGDPQRRDVEAFLLSFDTGTAPTVGYQFTLDATTSGSAQAMSDEALLTGQFQAGNCDVIVQGAVSGLQRGYVLENDGLFHSDRASEGGLTPDQMRGLATGTNVLTWSGVFKGTGQRAGVDRDRDGYRDRDELDAGSDPANANSTPASVAVNGPSLPARLSFSGAKPNPFRNRTALGFALPSAGTVHLALYDLRGREVRVLLAGPQPAGPQSLVFDGRDAHGRELAAGMYYARLDFAGTSAQKSFVLLR